MNFTGFVIVLLLVGFIAACAWVVWFRKDPTAANATADKVEHAAGEVAGDAKAAATGLIARFKAWRARRKG